MSKVELRGAERYEALGFRSRQNKAAEVVVKIDMGSEELK
jgi:hypothetical protein